MEVLQHGSMLPGWSQLPARANPHLSRFLYVDMYLITIAASQSKFLGFIMFSLALQGIQQEF